MKISRTTEGGNQTIIEGEYYTVYIGSGYNRFTQVEAVGYAYEHRKYERRKLVEPHPLEQKPRNKPKQINQKKLRKLS